MVDAILQWLNGIPKDIVVMIIAALPVSELRGAIPVALAFGMSFQKAFCLAVVGNAIPVIPILFLFKPVSDKLGKTRFFAKFFNWLEKRTLKRADAIQKYEMLGLILFVAIPLPMTGAYTGAIAASLLKMKFRYAFIGTMLGILIAGLVVTTLCVLWGTLPKVPHFVNATN
ncbi:MAG: small multi-drug export protein [Candidatus Omnitrophota bacterium]